MVEGSAEAATKRQWVASTVEGMRKQLVEFAKATWIVFSVGSLLIILLFLFSAFDWAFWGEQTIDAKGVITEIKIDRLKIVQQIALFVLAMIGLGLAIWRSMTAHRQAQAALAQSKTAIRQAETAENGQRFDRYARAAQMLDNEKGAVRSAGVYLLRELAVSDPQGYKTLCAELLASFIRARQADIAEKSKELTSALTSSRTPETPADVVDALKGLVLAASAGSVELDIRSSVFCKINFDHRHSFENVDIRDCTFTQVGGHGAIFDNCYIGGATFAVMSLLQANARSTYFSNCRFVSVEFEDVDFSEATFSDCGFKDCKFRNCDMSGVEFIEDEKQHLPFDAELLKTCWAWKGHPPKLGATFTGTIFDGGVSDAARSAFLKRREARRIAGANYNEVRPSPELKMRSPALATNAPATAG
jgi:uncharacterized protein YjbI with pentapeptide repeats